MATTNAATTANGVDVAQLQETVGAIQQDPSLAEFRFRAHNRWEHGGHSRTEIRSFYGAGQEDDSRTQTFVIEGDEPPVLLGGNQAPNAVEAVLHALASCLAVGFAYNAAAKGIEVRDLEFELEGDLNLHGFLGLSDQVRAGYSDIRVTYTVDCDADEQTVAELCEYVQRTSPVMDILRNPVDVEVRRA